jgi:hypothetical protein
LLIDNVGAGEPETDHNKVDDCPETIEDGVALKEEIAGATAAEDTVTVAVAVTEPLALVAVKV